MPVHLLKQSIIAQRALVLGFTIILVLLFLSNIRKSLIQCATIKH